MRQPFVAFVLLTCSCRSLEPMKPAVVVRVGTAPESRLAVMAAETVTIVVRDASVHAIVDEFRLQVPWVRFDVSDGWSDDYRVKAFVVRRENWRSALKAFAAIVDAELRHVTASEIHLCRPPRVAFGAVARTLARMNGWQIHIDARFADADVPRPVCQHGGGERYLQELVRALPAARLVKGTDGAFYVISTSATVTATLEFMVLEIAESSGVPTAAEAAGIDVLIELLDSPELDERDAAESGLARAGFTAIHQIRTALKTAAGERKSRLESVVQSLWTSFRSPLRTPK